jgi:hypothetical protein
VIDIGFAVIVTVGAGLGVTVTVVVAVVVPPAPVAVAVYVVVALGLTGCVPPVACSVYELPLLPVTITPVALVAVTVNKDELPAVIDAGLAVMATVGAGFGVTVMVVDCELFPPGPVAVAVYIVVLAGLTD